MRCCVPVADVVVQAVDHVRLTMSNPSKRYIGDSVYAANDGYHIMLTTENGYGASNTIALEDAVFLALCKYAEEMWDVKISIISNTKIGEPDNE
jgi:putative N-acetylmannosamine-6-phosphate epimerase